MPTSRMSAVIDHLRGTALRPEGAGLTDVQLLETFVSHRDAAALEALVRRHGPMVWGVCRRILANHHDAEDAFQATFLVLVRKAAFVEKVGNWLYGVAYQTAMKARATRAKRRLRETQPTTLPEPAVTDPERWDELQPLLDQELSRLPDCYRAAVVLCDLEGKSRKEAARQLGLPEGTVGSRLTRGRALLARRLAQRGLAVAAGALAGVLAREASAAVPASVLGSAIKTVTLVTAGKAAGVISAKVAALTEGVVKAMLLTRLKNMMAVTLATVLTLGIGAALFGQGAAAGEQAEAKKVNAVAPQDPNEASAVIAKAIRAHGGEQALARLRMVRIKVHNKDTETGKETVGNCETTVHLPGKLKVVQQTELAGAKASMISVVYRGRGWFSNGQQVQDIPADLLPLLAAELYAREIELLTPLREKRFALSTLPEIRVNRRAASGVKVTSTGHADVKLYFDKETGLLVKRAQSVPTPMGGSVLDEMVYSDYREQDGVKVPGKIVQFNDGKKTDDGLVAEVQFLQKIEDRVFAKPEGTTPRRKGGESPSVAIRQEGMRQLEVALAKRIASAPAKAMKASGLAGVMGGAHVRVLSEDEQEILLPLPQLVDGQVPVSFFIRSTPPDAVKAYRLSTSAEGNVAVLIRLAGKKQHVKIAWSSVVLLASRNIAPNRTPVDPYLKATGCVQSGAPEIANLARKLWPKSGKARDFAANIRQHIEQMQRIRGPLSLDALGILKSGDNRICTANANLAAALMRSKGIACRSVAVIPPIAVELEMHRIVEYSDQGRWQSFDPSSVHLDIPLKPCQSIIMARTTIDDEQLAMNPRMSVMIGCPYGQGLEMLTSGVMLFGDDMYWTLAKPLAEFEPNEECVELATEAWRRYLKTGGLTAGQVNAWRARNATELVKLLKLPKTKTEPGTGKPGNKIKPASPAVGPKDKAKSAKDQAQAIDKARKVDLPLPGKADKVVVEVAKRPEGKRLRVTLATVLKARAKHLEPEIHLEQAKMKAAKAGR